MATAGPVLSSGTGLAQPAVGQLHAGRIGEADAAPLQSVGGPTAGPITQAPAAPIAPQVAPSSGQSTPLTQTRSGPNEPARLRAPVAKEPLTDLPPGEPIAPYTPATVTTQNFVEPAGGLPDLGVIPTGVQTTFVDTTPAQTPMPAGLPAQSTGLSGPSTGLMSAPTPGAIDQGVPLEQQRNPPPVYNPPTDVPLEQQRNPPPVYSPPTVPSTGEQACPSTRSPGPCLAPMCSFFPSAVTS